jgi:hypothetical protein
MAFDRSQVEETLKRAIARDTREATDLLEESALRALGAEVGISPEAMALAIAEVRSPERGLLGAGASRSINASPDEVRKAAEAYLRMRGMVTDGQSVWRQASGWWPDLFRFTASTTVSATVFAATHGAAVRLTAALDRVWRAHIIAALLGPLFLVAVAVLGYGFDRGAALLAVAWPLFSAWSYLFRRATVQRRLEGALRDIARPDYLLAPW